MDSRLREDDEGMAPLWSPRRDGGTWIPGDAGVTGGRDVDKNRR